MSGPELSRVVRENMDALAQREVNGTAEHGDNMDRTDYTASQWAAEWNSEHLDAANYSRKLMHLLPRLEAAAAMLERLGFAWSGQVWQQVAASTADQDPIRTQVQAALDSLAQAAIYPADGEFAKTCLQHALVLITAGYYPKGGGDSLRQAAIRARRCLAWACEQRPEFNPEYEALDAALQANGAEVGA